MNITSANETINETLFFEKVQTEFKNNIDFFSIILQANYEIEIWDQVQGSTIGILTKQLEIFGDSNINTTGMGCASDKGTGAGIFEPYFQNFCGSPGGSYGGVGGTGDS